MFISLKEINCYGSCPNRIYEYLLKDDDFEEIKLKFDFGKYDIDVYLSIQAFYSEIYLLLKIYSDKKYSIEKIASNIVLYLLNNNCVYDPFALPNRKIAFSKDIFNKYFELKFSDELHNELCNCISILKIFE